jgi:hypothetical protein
MIRRGKAVSIVVTSFVQTPSGKEAKQPVEVPVTGEEVAQLEIGVGQIERREEEKVEEEEKEEHTTEASVSGEGIESDEDLGEIDEGLLEHAMNTGIFNDDDREHFQASIERIQTTRSTRSFVVE